MMRPSASLPPSRMPSTMGGGNPILGPADAILDLRPRACAGRPPISEASMCFWNICGLGVADFAKGTPKLRAIAMLIEAYDIVCVAETKTPKVIVAKWTTRFLPTHLVFIEDTKSQAAGGMLMFVNRRLLLSLQAEVEFQTLVPARAVGCIIKPKFAPWLYCAAIHNFEIDAAGLQHIRAFTRWAASAVRVKGQGAPWGGILADFNFADHGERWRRSADGALEAVARSSVDTREKARWSSVLDRLLLVSPSTPTHFCAPAVPHEGGSDDAEVSCRPFCSAIDKVFVDIDNWALPFARITAGCAEEIKVCKLSDHKPVFVRILSGVQRLQNAYRKTIPKYVIEDPMFFEHVHDSLCGTIQDIEAGDPFLGLERIKEKLQSAAKSTLHKMALRKRFCASAKASAVHSIATALVLNDFTKIKRAFGVLPNLRAAFDLRSARIRVVDHRLWKAVSDQVINEAHQQKLEAASSRGTSIRYVERLLRDGERFLPFRRRLRVAGVIDDEGNSVYEPAAVAEQLRQHWSPIFQKGRTCELAQDELLNDFCRPCDAHRVLPITAGLIGGIIERGNYKSPGPDGIMGRVWAKARFFVTHTFLRCAVALAAGRTPPRTLNQAYLVWIPKKAYKQDALGLAARPCDLRPLSLKNSSAKILWKVLPAMLADILPGWAAPVQRGFVATRQPIRNLLDLDASARAIAVTAEKGYIVSTDFATAFPAIDQGWIVKTMRRAFFPETAINLAIASLDRAEFVTHSMEKLFDVTSGVGQGCTSASTLFVIGAEPIIRAIQGIIDVSKHETLVAFADDLALCLASGGQVLRLGDLLFLVRSASALSLQPQKSQLVPIGFSVRYPEDVRCDEMFANTEWKEAQFLAAATITGVLVGPGATSESALEAPIKKFLTRAREIGKAPLSPIAAARLLGILAIPVLTYVTPLFPPTRKQSWCIQRGLQACLHLPEFGIAPKVLANLSSIIKLMPASPITRIFDAMIKTGSRAGAYSRAMRTKLQNLFLMSDYSPLVSTSASRCTLSPCGWQRPPFASVICDWADQRVPEYIRPLDSQDAELAREFHRRLCLWAPAQLTDIISPWSFAYMFDILRNAPARDAIAWTRMIHNALCTMGRFGEYHTCHVCGAERDSLRHLISCELFLTPAADIVWPNMPMPSLFVRVFSPEAVGFWGILFRAHAALRGAPAEDWKLSVKAARL